MPRPRSTATRRRAGRSTAGKVTSSRRCFGSPLRLQRAGEITVEMVFERYYAAGLGRFRISATTDPRAITAREIPFELEPILLLPEGERKPEQVDRLREYYLSVAPELAKERAEIEKLEKEMPQDPTTLVMQERPAQNPRPTFVHNRGEFLQPKERVEPAVLSMLPPMAADVPRNRLGLARWLVSGSNPLTGRVTMNYQWAAFFGRGLVRTVEDFGYQGERPTHPELLDWLAVSLVEQGWSMKAMHRAIVTSATYRQSSRVSPEVLAKDPENRLLARGPRVRLEAEVIRDSVLDGQRPAFRADRRAERLPAAAAGRFDRGSIRRAGVEREPRGRPVPPRPLYVQQADGPICDVADVRRSQRRGVRGAARDVELAAAGAHAAERSGLRGREPGARAADGEGSRGPSRSGSAGFSGCVCRARRSLRSSRCSFISTRISESGWRSKELDAAKIAGSAGGRGDRRCGLDDSGAGDSEPG